MLELIFTIAIIGLIVWAIITYIPMPQPLQGIIIVIALLGILGMFLGGGGLHFGHSFC